MKKLLNVIIALLILIFPVISFSNYLKFTPASNTNWNGTVLTGKYNCSMSLKAVAVHSGGNASNFTSCEFYVDYSSGTFNLSNRGHFTYHITGVNILGRPGLFQFASQVGDGQGPADSTITCATFSLKQTNLTGVYLKFVNEDGGQNSTTNNGLTLASAGSTNLGAVRDLMVNYEACPCTGDSSKPTWTQTILTGDLNGSKTRVAGSIHLTGIINDKGGTSWDYRFNGHDYSLTGLNYTSAPAGMDNQVGVNSGTIKVKVTYNGQTKEININSADLTVLLYNQGNLTKTWNNKDRGYTIDFETGDFAREKDVKIEIIASDNTFGEGTQCQWGNARSGTIRTYQFNTGSHNPTIRISKIGSKEISESDWAAGIREINPDDSITFEVEDDWSGIDTGTLKISFPEIKIISGDEEILLFTGVEYSWTDFTGYNELVGVDSFHGSGVKKFTIDLVNHPDWPTNTGINLTGEVYDYENNKGTLGKIFNTRKDCSEYYGCYNPLKLNFMSGGVLITDYRYKSGVIIVTGTVAPYPYLTGENNDILMCGPVDLAITLTGIKIYGTDGNEISPYEYSQTGLYITGLDYTYMPQSDEIGEYGEITITK